MNRITELYNIITKANNDYYNKQATISDTEYDLLKAELKQLDPSNELLIRVGHESEFGSKVTHNIPMGSLDNTEDGITGLPSWYAKMTEKLGYKPEVMASLKVDGSSIVIDIDRGALSCIATRGNGVEGNDITKNAIRMQDIPYTYGDNYTASVRGEAVLCKNDFNSLMSGKSSDDITNPRNVGNGIVMRESGENINLIKFIAFNISTELKSEQNKFDELKRLGYSVVPHKLCKNVEEIQQFYEQALESRDSLPYHIDGVVVALNSVADQQEFVTNDIKSKLRPKFARAIKLPKYTNTTLVIGCTISVGHTGAVVPTLDLKSVKVGQVNVDSVCMTNFSRITEMDLAVGDTIEVSLAGDIIPYCERVVCRNPGRKPITVPDHCPTCGHITTNWSKGRHSNKNLYCSNDECPSVQLGKISHWIGSSKHGVGILDIGDSIIHTLWANSLIADPADLYKLKPEDFEDLQMNGAKGSKTKIGHSRAVKICDNIAAKMHLPLHIFLGSLGVDMLGRGRVTQLQQVANGQLDTLEDWLDDNKFATIKVDGLGRTVDDPNGESDMRYSIRSGIKSVRPLIDKLLSVGVTVGGFEQEATTGKFSGLSFCFTGTREFLDEVKALGGKIDSDVRKGTNFLVQKGDKESSKAVKAAKLGVKVITVDRLKQAIAGLTEI